MEEIVRGEVSAFYSDRGIPIKALIDKRPSGLLPENVETAALAVYEEIQGGLKIKTIEIPRYVWRRARDIDYRSYVAGTEMLNRARREIDLMGGGLASMIEEKEAVEARLLLLRKRSLIVSSVLGLALFLLILWNLFQLFWRIP